MEAVPAWFLPASLPRSHGHTHAPHTPVPSALIYNHSLALDFTDLKGAERGERGTLFFSNLIQISLVVHFQIQLAFGIRRFHI